MPDIPDTNDYNVALLAVTWEILKATMPGLRATGQTNEQRLTSTVNDFIRVYEAIKDLKPIGDSQA